jgi:hypothetical protein
MTERRHHCINTLGRTESWQWNRKTQKAPRRADLSWPCRPAVLRMVQRVSQSLFWNFLSISRYLMCKSISCKLRKALMRGSTMDLGLSAPSLQSPQKIGWWHHLSPQDWWMPGTLWCTVNQFFKRHGCFPGDIRPRLETFLVVTTGEGCAPGN